MAIALAFGTLAGAARAADLNDYPTDARADFVFGCMKANGDTHDALERCSCAIDVIATILPYKAYEKGETVASLDLDHGQIGRMMHATTISKLALDRLYRARAEAEVRCF